MLAEPAELLGRAHTKPPSERVYRVLLRVEWLPSVWA
jgi:hypothetical protein